MSEIINKCGGETLKKTAKKWIDVLLYMKKSHKNYVGKNANCKM